MFGEPAAGCALTVLAGPVTSRDNSAVVCVHSLFVHPHYVSSPVALATTCAGPLTSGKLGTSCVHTVCARPGKIAQFPFRVRTLTIFAHPQPVLRSIILATTCAGWPTPGESGPCCAFTVRARPGKIVLSLYQGAHASDFCTPQPAFAFYCARDHPHRLAHTWRAWHKMFTACPSRT